MKYVVDPLPDGGSGFVNWKEAEGKLEKFLLQKPEKFETHYFRLQ
jgi:hypothetical protein